MILELLLFILTGAIAGLLSGLLGIGGGVVVVPCLFYALSYHGIPPNEIMQIVLGTSLATIAFNTALSSRGHWKRHAVMLRALRRMLPGLILGAFLGATAAKYVPSEVLKWIFAVFEIMLGFYFFFMGPEGLKDENKLPSVWPMALIGVGISGFSTLLGIGGGVLTVPMLLFFKVPMRKAIGTSAATSFIIACIGTLSYLIYGFNQSGVVMTLGYIYIPALLAVCGGTVLSSPLGVALAHKIPTQALKKIFAVILVVIGVSMMFSS